jgi:hypothetical protein
MNVSFHIKPAIRVLAIAFMLVLPFRLAAGLQWEQNKITINMPDGQDSAKLAFPFKNTGTDSVGIMSVEVSCSCLKFDPINGEYKPGESGVLNLWYQKGMRSNAVSYKITVHTTDPETPVHTLMVTVAANDNFQIDPASAGWPVGSESGTRELLFRDMKNIGVKPVAAYSTSANFNAEIEPRQMPGEYAIKVTPNSTEKAGGAYIYIDVAFPDGKVEKTRVLAAIIDPNSKRISIR